MVWRARLIALTTTATVMTVVAAVAVACGDDTESRDVSPSQTPNESAAVDGSDPAATQSSEGLKVDESDLASMALTLDDLGSEYRDLILIQDESGPQPRTKIFSHDECDPAIAQALDRSHWRGGYVRSYQSQAARDLGESDPDSGELLYVVSALVLLQDDREATSLFDGMIDEFKSEERERSTCGSVTFEKTTSFDVPRIGDASFGYAQSLSGSATEMTSTWVFFRDGPITAMTILIRYGSDAPANSPAKTLAEKLGERIDSVAGSQQ